MSRLGRGLLWTLAVAAVVAAVASEVLRPVADVLPAADLAASGIPPAVIEQARAYRDGNLPILLASLGVRLAVGAIALSPPVRRRAAGWVRVVADRRAVRGRRALRPWLAALLGTSVWIVADVVRLPLQLAAWRRSVDVGLSTLGPAGWLRDWALVTVPYWVGVALVIALVVWLIEVRPRTWVPLAGLLLGASGVLLIIVSPRVLEPLLFDFAPLTDEALAAEIEQLSARALGRPADEVLVANASQRTTASNAYVSGLLGTRRVVLYDTLLRDAPRAEVLAIVAHELAHRANADIARTAAIVMGASVAGIALLGLAFRGRLRGPGGHARPAMVVPVVGATLLLAVAVTPVERWSSRRAEAAADAGALALTGDGATFVEMMSGLAERNLSDPDPPTWLVGLAYTHPPVAERIARGLAVQGTPPPD